MVEQRGTAIPGHRREAAHHIVTGQRGHWNGNDAGEVEACASLRNSASMARKRFRVVNQIHLVDGEHHILDADEVADGGGGSGASPRGGHRRAGSPRRARHRSPCCGYIARAQRIDDDEAAMRGLEIAPGDVDGDALLALGLEAVEQQAEIDFLAVLQAVL